MSDALTFTGERFQPECTGEIWYEHWHRYGFVCQFVPGCKVLDVACGEGYGSALLAQHASEVVGVDISGEAVRHACERYAGVGNLNYMLGSCDRLPLADASFDVVVSFETIEHIASQEEMLAEIRRVLKPDGLLVMSAPNKKTYSDDRNYHNEFHVREHYRGELLSLLEAQFDAVRWFNQKLLFHSTIWQDEALLKEVQLLVGDDGGVKQASRIPSEAMYYIVICARNEALIPSPEGQLSMFTDQRESIYHEYEKAIRHAIQLDRLLGERERVIQERDDMLGLRTGQMEERERIIVERDSMLALRTSQLQQHELQLQQLESQRNDLEVKGQQLESQRNDLEVKGQQLESQRNDLAAKGQQLESELLEVKRQLAEHSRLVRVLEQELEKRKSWRWWLKRPFEPILNFLKKHR